MADLRALEVDPPAAVERRLQLAQARGADGAVALAVGEGLTRHRQATGAPVRHPVAQQALGLRTVFLGRGLNTLGLPVGAAASVQPTHAKDRLWRRQPRHLVDIRLGA